MNVKITKREQVREKIKEYFKTQEIFAVCSGINEAVVSKIIRGIRKPTEQQKAVFAELLETPADRLFEE